MAKKGSQTVKKSFLEGLIQWMVVGIFAVLPLLYFPNRAASYVTSKQYFFIGAVDVLVVLWTWLLLADRRYRLSRKNLLTLLPLFLFLVSLTISAIVGVDPATSFLSTVESGTGLITLYHVLLFACIIASIVRVQQKRFIKYIAQANLFASAALAVCTFFTGNSGVFEINSKMLDYSSGGAMMGNSLLVGAYFIFSVFLSLYLVAHESRMWKKILYWIGTAIIVFSPIYFNAAIFKGKAASASYGMLGEARIAAVSLLIGLAVSFFLWLLLHKRNAVLKSVGIAGLAIIILGGSYAAVQIAAPTTPIHQFFVKEGGNRSIDWQEAVQGIKDRPLLGWGPENFHVVYQKYLDPIVFSPGHGDEVWALHPHNNSLEVLINGGVIGGVCYLLVLLGIIYTLIYSYRKEKIDRNTLILFSGMLIAFFMQQQMIYDSIVSYTMFFSIIAIIAGFSDVTDEKKPFAAISGLGYAASIAVVALLFPVWLYGAYFPAHKMEELQQVGDAHSDARIGMYQHLFHSTGSYAINTDVEFYTDPLFFSYQPEEQVLKSNPTYQKIASQELSSLLTAVAPVWITKPYDYHLTLSLVQLENLQFYLTGDKNQLANADIYAERAFALSPTDPQIYFSYAQTLVYEGKTGQARAMLDKAISLNPNYQPAVDFRKMLQ